jgi:eukaryotic-like serine/threonine-protein kinase
LASPSKVQPGMVLGNRYRILRLLGQGGMGQVYLAEDSRLPGKHWAVKELRPDAADQEMLKNEARFLAECSHPGLAAITDFIPADDDGICYLVMEYIHGVTLSEAFRLQQPFPWEKAVRIGVELCEVLAYLHEGRPKPIIHRDLKPSNIMLDENGRVRLIDFGTARYYNQSASADTVQLGTIGFAAPEQLLGKQTDARTDLFALGALLYYLLNEGRLWHRGQGSGKMQAGAAASGTEDVVLKLLEENPASRIQTAAEAGGRLEAALNSASGMQPGQPAASELHTSLLQKQIIVVGGLTEGSGSSFIAAGLARVLHRSGIRHAVVELPGVKPDMYHYLFGEKRAPKGYLYRSENALWGAPASLEHHKAWVDGFTEWVPLPPDRPFEDWTSEAAERLLGGLEQQVVIVDAGAAWQDAAVEAVCRRAGLALLVCGPSPVHLSRREAAQNWQQLQKLQQEGAEVRVVANKSIEFRGKGEWIGALPSEPVCYVPEFPSALLLSALWRGELAADLPVMQPALAKALEPVMMLIRKKLPSPGKEASAWKRLRKSLGLRQ